MNLLQIFMTAFLVGTGYFLLVAFTGLEHRDTTFQMTSLAGMIAGSFLFTRKVFGS